MKTRISGRRRKRKRRGRRTKRETGYNMIDSVLGFYLDLKTQLS